MSHKTKVLFGLIFIIFAFLCMLAAAFFIKTQNENFSREINTLQVEMVNLMTERSQQVFSETEQEKVKRDPIRIEDVLARAEIIYGPEELKRKEGILWIDRKTASLLVTLGSVNGLVSGSSLGVYQERRQPSGFVTNEKIGEVIVEKAYDIISYVKPLQKPLHEFARDYYRVIAQ